MKILVFTSLYPNAAMPRHGVFVENRLLAYQNRYNADVKVIAPVPWFPFQNETFGAYARWARVPEKETRHGVEIHHPRFLTLPKIGMTLAPASLARCFRRAASEFISGGWDFDLIDAHYFYPDGVAAAQVAAELQKPVVITGRGTDINLIPAYRVPRKKIARAAMNADAVITVSQALKDDLAALGAPGNNITVLRNGVDLETFKPQDRERVRERMGLSGPVIASVGHLIDRKGHDIVIAALKDVPDATLLIVGEGKQRRKLAARARNLGVSDRVRFLGAWPYEEMHVVYNAADILALASSREGWPNVLLEAMACGCPCVASNAPGTKEVIRERRAGGLVDERTPGAFASALNALLANLPDRTDVRRYAEAHSWDETTDGMHEIFTSLAAKTEARKTVKTTPLALESSRPKLLVTIDTEEQFDWSNFDDANHQASAPGDVAKFQALCEEAGVAPLYFVTWPLMNDAEWAAYLRNLIEKGDADAGLHLHQWVTPPEGNFRGEYFSFQKNLPHDAHRNKLKMLAEQFEHVFGFQASAHRAGRYGVAPENYNLLAETGVRYDFSPSPGFDFSGAGGPNFSGYSNAPFVVGTAEGEIFVTPVCGAEAIKGTRAFLSRKALPVGFAPPKRAQSPVPKRSMRLSPEGAGLKDMQALTRRLMADQTPVLTFTLHSTSLTPGANAYAKEAAAVEKLLQTTKAYFEWFRQMGGEMVSLRELRTLYDPVKTLIDLEEASIKYAAHARAS